jgi:putative FmdB family regulatory protein
MPLYEYECFLCHHRFERIQRVADAPVTKCPACGGAVRRLLGVPALQFKGSGFYITDYGKGNSGDSASRTHGKEETSSTSSESSPAAKDDSKPAATSDGAGKDKKAG